MNPREEERAKRSRRTYSIVSEFAEKFDRQESALTDKAHNEYLTHVSFTDLVGQCVSEFFLLRDAVDGTITQYEKLREEYLLQKYYDESKKLHDLVDRFQGIIQQVRSRNLMDEERESQRLRQKNTELDARVTQLSIDLKKCRDDFEAYKATVKPLGYRKNPEYGDVVKQ